MANGEEGRVDMVQELERLSTLVESTVSQVSLLRGDMIAQRFERQEEMSRVKLELHDLVAAVKQELKQDIGTLFRNGPISGIQREIAALKERVQNGSSEPSAGHAEASAVRSELSTFKTAVLCSLLAAVITLLGIGAKDMIDRANNAAARSLARPTPAQVGP